MFVRSNIRRLLADQEFGNIMIDLQKQGWVAFTDVVEKFFDNSKDPDCKNIVTRMLKSFQALSCLTNLRVHFLLLKQNADLCYPCNKTLIFDKVDCPI